MGGCALGNEPTLREAVWCAQWKGGNICHHNEYFPLNGKSLQLCCNEDFCVWRKRSLADPPGRSKRRNGNVYLDETANYTLRQQQQQQRSGDNFYIKWSSGCNIIIKSGNVTKGNLFVNVHSTFPRWVTASDILRKWLAVSQGVAGPAQETHALVGTHEANKILAI